MAGWQKGRVAGEANLMGEEFCRVRFCQQWQKSSLVGGVVQQKHLILPGGESKGLPPQTVAQRDGKTRLKERKRKMGMMRIMQK